MTSELGQKMQQKPRKSTNILKNNEFLDVKDLSNQQYLEDLAERSYFNFLSDIITVSRSRSLNASIEELAMQRILSERLYSYFSQPNQVKLLRHEMIRAAQDVQDIHPDNNSNSGR